VWPQRLTDIAKLVASLRAPKIKALLLVAKLVAAVIVAAQPGCSAPPPVAPSRYARAEQIEMNFRGQSFVLGDNNQTAMVSPASAPNGRVFRLPFWLGVNVLVPGVLQPKEGDYYVISEAVLVKLLGNPDEWLIEAGSSLIKKETVLVATRTRFRSVGKMLPMIVQFVGMRTFTRGDGTTVELPVLKEVSLPMKWTLGGRIPAGYARFEVR
jgi:hypothetical protein